MSRFRPLIVAAISAALAVAPDVVAAQTVPEGVHREENGPIDMCGLTAVDVTDLKAKVTLSAAFSATPIDTARFELFSAEEPLRQLVFTREGEAAYPAATCRTLEERDGSLHVVRSMRCEADRAECDALFLEFQALDAQLSGALKGEN